MNVDAIRIFVEAARLLSFAAVAEANGTSASTVSRCIAQIEKELGARLFQRTTRNMVLTEEGEIFLRSSETMLVAFDEAQERLRAGQSQPQGLLRLTASMAFGEQMIVPLLPAFREAMPELALELVLSDHNLDLVANNLDLAIRLAPQVQEGLIVSRLRTTRYRVCASPSYLQEMGPLPSPEHLANHDCLLLTLPAYRDRWRFRGKEQKPVRERAVTVRGKLHLSSPLSVRSAALAGLGPALLADWLVKDDIASGRLVDVFPDFEAAATDFDTAAWIAYPSRAHLPQKVRLTIDFLRERLGRS